MTSFTHLVLRPEPRAMIQTMFLGRIDYERLERKQQLPAVVAAVVEAVRAELERSRDVAGALARAGFSGFGEAAPIATRQRPGYWIDGDDAAASSARDVLARIQAAVAPLAAGRSEEDLRVADYAAVRQAGYPAYLGGPFALAATRAP